MVKTILIWIGVLLCIVGIYNPYQWYCSEMLGMGNLESIIFSFCFLSNWLYLMIAFGLLLWINIHQSNVIMILVSLLLFKIYFIFFNGGSNLSDDTALLAILQITKAHLGGFIGIFVSIIYFYKIKNIQKGLLVLIFLWLALHVVYPLMVQYSYS